MTNLLIHTSDHPTIDYTAVEGTDSTENYLKHYIAVFDPATDRLQLTEAKALTVRSTIRQRPQLDDSDTDQNASNIPTSQGTRAALTEAFGSKKSKKAVQSMAENRQLGQGGEGATIAEAMIANMSDEEEDTSTAAAAMRTNKPLPQPNLGTDDIEEVYSLNRLIFPSPSSNILKLMPIGLWTGRLRANKEIQNLRSRFVANRISYLGKHAISESDPAGTYNQQIQILRYVELLVEIAQFCSKIGHRKQLPFVDKWPEGTITGSTNIPSSVIKSVVNHFFPNNVASQHSMTLLRTTILALTLHVHPPSGTAGANRLVTEPTDIQLDLALEVSEVRKLYHELGCKIIAAVDRDLTVWGYTKILEKKKKRKDEDGNALSPPKPMFAVLRFPLDFPKASGGRRGGQGGRR